MADRAPSSDEPVDTAAALEETLAFLTVRPGEQADGEAGDTWVADAPEWFGDYLFGGFVIAQSIIAATRNAPEGRRLHSLHAYFLRPVFAGQSVAYRVRPLREGRSFTSRRVEASQDGKLALDMTCSFAGDTDGYVYDLPGGREIPPREDGLVGGGPGAWIAHLIGPTPPSADGTRESTHRMWFRIPHELPDDVHLHTALLGFATDWTETGGRPLHLEGDITGMVSLDHAAWFHRPARADEWLFYDVHSLVNAGGRGMLRGVIRDADGRVVISVAQEMRLTPIDDPP
jgi:acyl-CoA thioesterase-2